MAKLFIFAGDFCDISVFIQCENKVELVTGFQPVNQLRKCFYAGSIGDAYLDVICIILIKIIAEGIIAVFAFNFDVVLAKLGKLPLCLCYLTCDFCNLIIFNGSGNIHGLFVLIGIIEIFQCFNLIGAVGNGDIDIIYIINIIGLAANFYRTGVLAFLIGNACNIAVRIILAVAVGGGSCNFSNVILFIQCQCNGNGAIPIIVQIIQIFVVFCFVVNLYGNIICIIDVIFCGFIL